MGEEFKSASKKKNNREEPTDENTGNMMESTRQLYMSHSDWNEGGKLWLQQLKAMVIKRTLMNIRRMSLLVLQIVIPLIVSLIVQWMQSQITTLSNVRSRTVSFQVCSLSTKNVLVILLMSLLMTDNQGYSAFGSPTVILKCGGNTESPCHSLQGLLNGTAKFELAPDDIPLVPYLVEKVTW